ncbi:MAG: phosphotransferase [Patescibacteria group bacterium]
MTASEWDTLKKVLKEYNLDSNVFTASELPSFANRVWYVKLAYESVIVKEYFTFTRETLQQLDILFRVLNNVQIPVPSLYINKQGGYLTVLEGKYYHVFKYIDHRPLTYTKLNITDSDLEKAGRQLARIHLLNATDVGIMRLDFEVLNMEITNLVNGFTTRYKKDAHFSEDKLVREKIDFLFEYLQQTKKIRAKILDDSRYFSFQNEPSVFTHGDYSLTNLLPDDKTKTLYVIDWDEMQWRPRMFELQRSVGLLCGKGVCNANLDEINERKATIFLQAYSSIYPLTLKHAVQLSEVA